MDSHAMGHRRLPMAPELQLEPQRAARLDSEYVHEYSS